MDDERAALFANLHGRVVSYEITSNTFVKSGGIVRIKMTTSTQGDGGLTDKSIEFQASDCTGVCFVTSTISFQCEMLMQETPALADASEQIFTDDDLAALESDAPPTEAVA